MRTFQGIYFNGQSPAELPLAVKRGVNSWFLAGENLMLEWAESEVRLEWIASELHLSHPKSPEHVILRDLRKEDLLALGLKKEARSVSEKARLALVLGVATVVLFLGVWFSLRPVSYMIARQIPSESERALLDGLLPVNAVEANLCTQQDAQRLLQRVGDSLLEKGEPPLSFGILDWSMPNAFAFPGRRIYVTQGMLESIKTSEQLYAVLGHEKGHIDLRHNLGETIHSVIAAFVWAVVVGDFSGAFIIDPELARNLSDSAYSREHEADADRYGAELLIARGHDPKALGSALRLMTRPSEEKMNSTLEELPESLAWLLKALDSVFSSHPETERRAAAMRSSYPTAKSREILSAGEWKFLKNACREGGLASGIRGSDTF